MVIESLLRFLSVLAAVRFFEDAADATLKLMLEEADDVLQTSPYAERGRILRGMVHLRPDDGYRRLWIKEHGRRQGGVRFAYLPSATAWRWVAERRCPVSIDVELGTVRPWIVDESGKPPTPISSTALGSQETRDKLRERDATHVHVLPLLSPGGAVVGMVSIEARAGAVGEDFIWPDCADRLAALAGLAGAHLAALPLRPSPEAVTDELLPVVGASTAGIVELLRVFSQQEETILLGGPTGAGKSRLARWCHARSKRKDQHFEVLDLLSVPEELQMGELFGWKRGAFTGAVKDNPGAIARAEGGTLFIDEIDKLSLKAQAGLLHIIEERTYRSIGDVSAERKADVRFIVGTNADLHVASKQGRFREDLYYRINVLPVKVPPLAERLDELPMWADYMLQRRHAEGGGQGTVVLTSEAKATLHTSPWPGNLRQLDNILRRGYAFALLENSASGGIVLERRHIERALAYEGLPRTPLAEELRHAAAAFVDEALRRNGTSADLSFELTDAFKGLVLGAAVERLGSREEAFRLLGLEGLVKSRNHHRTFRREVERAAELLCAMDPTAGADLLELLADDRSPER